MYTLHTLSSFLISDCKYTKYGSVTTVLLEKILYDYFIISGRKRTGGDCSNDCNS